ncbi:NAD-dependent succinate-semialdehyde dehydrogenase [Actinomycetospora straminea]|uniref:NADP-dependent succinic semialdehyde dehydrogenase n=1 Tax=Actinomycetospora straminea TaxID=663607 RepID=A0ABP9F3M9_9PSEU|nr:NAD-dependent succinate-semialdehyde dehydrogenase [Actinomycetospora straminea]MDD7932878.1 NAD-dependent succinate-semialdehyde dehydrogenase [Actinomycetospora straminea]
MAIATTNPATGQTVEEFESLTSEQLEEKLQRAWDTFESYRDTTFEQRAGWLRAAADIFDAETDRLAELATLEMGKTFTAAKAEIAKCALGCRWYADHAAEDLADVEWPKPKNAPENARIFTRYQPLGPVLAIMPWNFPFWQVLRFAAPALMAGNVGLLKHASNVPQVAMAIEDVLNRAGFPEGAFQTLLVGSSVIEGIIDDPRVRAVTLTGSEPAGREVGARAGQNVKTSVLELGGSDPFIVMPSVEDLDAVVDAAVSSRMLNNGQSCINAKRFIVHQDIADDFTQKLVAKMESLTIGDPMDENTDLGPMSQGNGVTDLDEQVQDSIKAGARLLTGGERIDKPGNWYPPTVLTDIPKESRAYSEELFGPVALVFRATDADDAIRIANDSDFGLGGSAWTSDEDEKMRFATEVESGMVYINKITESTPEVPFGGAKNSGYGRELASFGPQSFVNAKTIWIQ